jgi:hypothetical protein
VDGATVSVAVVASRTEAELIVGMLRSYGRKLWMSPSYESAAYLPP